MNIRAWKEELSLQERMTRCHHHMDVGSRDPARGVPVLYPPRNRMFWRQHHPVTDATRGSAPSALWVLWCPLQLAVPAAPWPCHLDNLTLLKGQASPGLGWGCRENVRVTRGSISSVAWTWLHPNSFFTTENNNPTVTTEWFCNIHVLRSQHHCTMANSREVRFSIFYSLKVEEKVVLYNNCYISFSHTLFKLCMRKLYILLIHVISTSPCFSRNEGIKSISNLKPPCGHQSQRALVRGDNIGI